ncbi:TKL protein kinase [Salpingoeca rosetta]|uniref:TKL protein kinase n=1 Tax=Salpingoeca rosetta (strain ATCC 50818 / BSB-021) TaxID=946362 RepID=F2UN39_SALR5|nr:TKL protein kinase [Salpingoeca rosetta]EGD78538.1 TKL protein kinase [Salpingoeca rosetta]|eukprot:XP_004989487.1 TKL protein kinase [Salpingoeca rosetta]
MDATSTCACTAHTGRRRHQQRANASDPELVHVRLKQHAAQRTLSSQWYLQYLPPALSSAYRRPHSTQRTRAFPGKLVTLLVMVVMVMAALGASSCTAFVAHSTPTTPLTTTHTTQALPAEGSQADASLSLCSEVDATLVHLTTTLETFGVPFTWPSNHDVRHPHTRSKAHTNFASGAPGTGEATRARAHVVPVDLSSIQRMMKAFGCCNTGTRHGSRRPSAHGVSDVQGAQQRDVPHVQPDAPRGSGNGRFLPAEPLQHQRVRRADPGVQPGRCTLASVIEGTCPGPDSSSVFSKPRLAITFAGDEHINGSTDAAALRALSPEVESLRVTGAVHVQPLQWLADNGNWSACTVLTIERVQHITFPLRILNRFTQIESLDIRHSKALRYVDTHAFAHRTTLRTLAIYNNSLTSLPDMGAWPTLQSLRLSDNHIRHVRRSEVGELTSLRTLVLSGNLLTDIGAATFDDLRALTELQLRRNSIAAIPRGLFHALTQMASLTLHANPITHLDADVFRGLSSLASVSLSSTLLTSLPSNIFSSSKQLFLVDLSDNYLTALPEHVFAGQSSLAQLRLHDNMLTSLPPALFRGLSTLSILFLSNNRITSLPEGLFDACTNLNTLFISRNRITALPPRLFARTRNLLQVHLDNNAIQSVDNLFFTNRLQFLDLEANMLTRVNLNATLPVLIQMAISNNPMQRLPALIDPDSLPLLQELRMQGHRMPHIDLALLLSFPSLRVLEIDAAPGINSKAVVSRDTPTAPPRLHTFSATHVDLAGAIPNMPPLQLDVLGVGWPGATETSLPRAWVCDVLADAVVLLRITATQFTMLDTCANKTFHTVLIQDNPNLMSVTMSTAVVELNASDCTHLAHIDAPSIDVLDISRTRVEPRASLCRRWGRRVVFARDMDEQHVDPQHAAAALGACLLTSDVVDLSGNTWLDNPGEVNLAIGEEVALSEELFLTTNLVTLENRPVPPILQLQGTPISCAIQITNMDLRVSGGHNAVTNRIVYAFHCTCARGYKATSRGRCELNKPDIAGIAAGSVIGGLALGLLMAWVSRRYRGLTKRIDLQEQLLVERDEEVMALKKAWEIEYDELRLVERVAAGAFGVVFKAEWDTVTVAVKVLQQAVMAFDESTVLEFEKEVEFLQRTRHPNVVRFFGAGTDPNGSPFLVLEYVALGSLKDLLGKDLEGVLMEVRSRKVEESSNGGVGDDVNSVWDLKLRLLRDVASGMAFIHSLDQMHRDLKSGNVLVSSSLRAKITDFGSIRQCFTRGGRAHSSGHTRLSSSQADDNPQYSQRTGLQTMTSVTLTAGVGTPLYMAPEALTGDKYSFEADIFSFGVLMWEVATQRPPDLIEQEKGSDFRGPLLPAITELLMEGKRLKFDETGAFPEWFQSLTYKCMAQNPRERPSFGELKDHHFA